MAAVKSRENALLDNIEAEIFKVHINMICSRAADP